MPTQPLWARFQPRILSNRHLISKERLPGCNFCERGQGCKEMPPHPFPGTFQHGAGKISFSLFPPPPPPSLSRWLVKTLRPFAMGQSCPFPKDSWSFYMPPDWRGGEKRHPSTFALPQDIWGRDAYGSGPVGSDDRQQIWLFSRSGSTCPTYCLFFPWCLGLHGPRDSPVYQSLCCACLKEVCLLFL